MTRKQGPSVNGVVVVGGSAGSIEGMRQLVSAVSPELGICMLVAIHLSSAGTSKLPSLLSRLTDYNVAFATDGDVIEPGQIFIAPPNRHLLVRPQGTLKLSAGPKENGSRPAVDPLFRSAAHAFGKRVVGIILSGALYDGTLGLACIKIHGGVAIVQDPEEALFSGMPLTAKHVVAVDYSLPLKEMPGVLSALASREFPDAEQELARVTSRRRPAPASGGTVANP